MKILIYTPIDETFEFSHATLIDGLLKLGIKQWMSPVLFAHYLRETKQMTVEGSIFRSIISTNKAMIDYEQLPNDMVLVGNCSRDFKFDLIIGYTQNTNFTPQPEYLLDIMRKKYSDDETLKKLLTDLYKAEDCESFLIDAKEVIKFIERILNEGKIK
jgi:hypothetical protein